MCVSSGPRICLICLLLYGFQAKADKPRFDFNTSDKYDVSTANTNVDDTEELYFTEKDFFLTKLMTKYGNGVEMSFEGFEHLLHNLGLGGNFKFDHEVSCHRSDNSSEFLQLHSHHNHSTDSMTSMKLCSHTLLHDHLHEHDDSHDNHKQHEHNHANNDEHNHNQTDEHHHDLKQTDDHDYIDGHNHDHEYTGHNHEPTDENNHDHKQTDGQNHDHEHTDEHNHDHEPTGDHNHDHEQTDGHNHDHEHTDEHNHNHEPTDYHNHDHEHTDEHNHDHEHTNEQNHDHNQTDEHNHDHEHTNEQNHDHNQTDEHNHIHEHTDEHNHDHEHIDEHKHEHIEEDNHKHGHTEDHSHDHDNSDQHNHDQKHLDAHDHNDDHTDEHNTNITDDNDHDAHSDDHDVHKRETDTTQCLSASVMLRLVSSDIPKSITKDMFKELCPSLVYQIDEDSCHSSHGGHSGFHGNHDDYHDHGDHDHGSHDHSTHAKSASLDISTVPPKVWGFSALAVIIISLVGLLGVAVIPIMQKVFYNHMLQFLVALAVGALSGDALLHLFPHAIAGGHEGHDHSSDGGHSHDTGPVYKGLCGLLGIYFFFFTERVLTMFTEYKRKKKQKKNRGKKCVNDEVGEKLANSECDGMMMSIHPNKALRAYADETHTEHCTISFENSTSVSHEHGQRKAGNEETCVDGDENSSMINNSISTSPRHHGHGHSHGLDEVPNSVASVAWMVIMGDGIHNFCDGLAIGAAFVNSITGGFSTSIAVFCHELPHEIGDFAMLLRAGMSPKQAIIYNCLSSILCFVGMLIGVAVGNMEGATLWVFSMVGGMFLYIALVDMLPELSSVETKKGEHPLCHLLLQGIGMLSGAGIMLAIALFEGDLMTILD